MHCGREGGYPVNPPPAPLDLCSAPIHPWSQVCPANSPPPPTPSPILSDFLVVRMLVGDKALKVGFPCIHGMYKVFGSSPCRALWMVCIILQVRHCGTAIRVCVVAVSTALVLQLGCFVLMVLITPSPVIAGVAVAAVIYLGMCMYICYVERSASHRPPRAIFRFSIIGTLVFVLVGSLFGVAWESRQLAMGSLRPTAGLLSIFLFRFISNPILNPSPIPAPNFKATLSLSHPSQTITPNGHLFTPNPPLSKGGLGGGGAHDALPTRRTERGKGQGVLCPRRGSDPTSGHLMAQKPPLGSVPPLPVWGVLLCVDLPLCGPDKEP